MPRATLGSKEVSFMCRLLAYVAPRPTSLVEVLGRDDFEDFTGLTTVHGDGWGMAWLDEHGALQHARSASSAQDDPRYRELAEQPLGRAGIVHLRWASPGIPRALENTHPFVDGDLAMAHNGHIAPIERLEQLLTADGCEALQGATDSERYFRYLAQSMRAQGSQDAVNEAVGDAVSTIAADFPAASLNALMLTPTQLFAIHVNSRATPPPALKGLGIAAERLRHTDDEYFGMDFRREDGEIHIISSGIDPEGWTDMPEDSIGLVDLTSGQLTWTKPALH